VWVGWYGISGSGLPYHTIAEIFEGFVQKRARAPPRRPRTASHIAATDYVSWRREDTEISLGPRNHGLRGLHEFKNVWLGKRSHPPVPSENSLCLCVSVSHRPRSSLRPQPTQRPQKIATALSGPPDPFWIFIGKAMTVAPRAGSSVRFVRFSRLKTFRAAAMRCTTKSCERP
jgi:hypothetical protein